MAGISSRAAGMQSGKHYFVERKNSTRNSAMAPAWSGTTLEPGCNDPQIGRWHSADPLAHATFGCSPYNFTLNNPVNLIDPDGRIVMTLA